MSIDSGYFSEVKTFLEYQPKNTDLLYQALTFPEIPAEKPQEAGFLAADSFLTDGIEAPDNRVLVLFGEQALPLYLYKNIADHYGFFDSDRKDYGEGAFRFRGGMNPEKCADLSRKLLSDEYLSERIEKSGIRKFLTENRESFIFGSAAASKDFGEFDAETRISENASLLKALIGMAAVDSRFNPGVLQNAVRHALSLEDFLEALPEEAEKPVVLDLESAVNLLKELADKGKVTAPDYRFDSPETLGEDLNGTPLWYCKCTVQEPKYIKGAFAASKKAAKKCASYLVLCDYYGQENAFGPDPDLIEFRVTLK